MGIGLILSIKQHLHGGVVLDLLGEFVNELRLHFALEIVFKDSSEVVLELGPSEVGENFLPVRWGIETTQVWLLSGSKIYMLQCVLIQNNF